MSIQEFSRWKVHFFSYYNYGLRSLCCIALKGSMENCPVTDDELLALALRAASGTDCNCEEACRLLVQKLNARLDENQKEVAAALSLMAKQVESSLGQETSFQFKQMTCAAMLTINMEQRRNARH